MPGTMAGAAALLVGAAIVGTAEAVDFASYMTCTDCIDAGFGWCPIRRTCGGFANQECGEGSNYVRPEYGAQLLKEEKKAKKGKKRADSELPDVEKVEGLEAFTRTVAKGDGLWAVLFCAEWSDDCKATRPEFEKAAKALRGVVRFAEVDAEADTDLAAEYGVSVFPTVLTFVSEKDAATGLKGANAPYAGARTAAALVGHVKAAVGGLLAERVGAAHADAFKVAADPATEAAEQARAAEAAAAAAKAEAAAAAAKKEADEAAAAAAAAAAKEKAKAKADADAAASAEGGKKKKKKKGKKSKKKKAAFRPGTGEFVEPVTGGAAEVAGLAKASTGHAVFVHVYDVKSEACSAAGEAFDAAASALRGMVTFHAVDGVKNTDLPFGMTAGNVYSLTATAATPLSDTSVDTFKNTALAATGEMPKVAELTGPSQLQDCLAQKLCIIAVLPDVTEGAEARNARIAALTEGASLVRAAARVLWAEAGAQPDLERQFDVLSYPSLVLLDGEAGAGRVHSLDAAADSVVAAALSEDARGTRFSGLAALDVQAWAGQAFAYPSA